MADHPIVIFGAGATKACGGPLTGEILSKAFKLKTFAFKAKSFGRFILFSPPTTLSLEKVVRGAGGSEMSRIANRETPVK